MPMNKSDLGPEVDAARTAYGEACIAAVEARQLYMGSLRGGPEGHVVFCKCELCVRRTERTRTLFRECDRLDDAAKVAGDKWAALVTAYEEAPMSPDDAADDRLEAARVRDV